MQFTPKHASWLNQVEMFFSVLARRLLCHGGVTDPDDLAVQMLACVEHYDLTAKPLDIQRQAARRMNTKTWRTDP